MGEKTGISWCDATFNPWMGCTKVSPACAHCYAERDMDKRLGKVHWGPHGTRVKTGEANWRQPLKWNREAEKSGTRQRVFCASLADVFEDWGKPVTDHRGFFLNRCRACDAMYAAFSGDEMCACHCRERDLASLDDLRRDLFALIDATPHLDWLLLTKRPENIRAMWPRCTRCRGNGRIEMLEHCPKCKGKGMSPRRSNVWLGTTVENQEYADQRIPELLKCRDLSPVLFLSCEPLLGPISLQQACTIACGNKGQCQHHAGTGHRIIQDSSEGGLWVECICSRLNGLSWVIAGGESGPQARPSHPAWFRGLRDQCQAAGVPFHFKQHGEWVNHDDYDPETMPPIGELAHRPIATHCFDEDTDSEVEMYRVGKKHAGRLLGGREWNEFPVEVAV